MTSMQLALYQGQGVCRGGGRFFIKKKNMTAIPVNEPAVH